MIIKTNKSKTLLGLLIALFMISVTVGYAGDKLNPVKDLKVDLQGKLDGDTFIAAGVVSWVYPQDNHADGFNIYYTEGKTDDAKDLKLLGSINKDDENNRQKDMFFFHTGELKSNHNIWTFTVTAFNEDGESDVVRFFYAEIKNNNPNHKAYIITHPELHAKIGTVYSYTPKVETDLDNYTLNYKLHVSPDGAKIDQSTGEITWTPSKSGRYHFGLIIEIIVGDKVVAVAEQVWDVTVFECDELAKIKGTVKDEDGNLISYGVVSIFNFIQRDGKNTKGPVIQIKFSNGEFEFSNLDKGEYYILVEAFSNNNTTGYYPNWYENAANFDHATPLVVECGDEVELAFVMKAIPHPKHHTVKGKIVDSETLEPVKFSMVEFIGRDKNSDKTQSFVFKVNDHGEYTGSLPDIYEYIAVANGHYFSDNHNTTSAYFPQYYELADNPTDAKVITMNEDKTGIDFFLKAIPNYENSISGTVVDSNDTVLPGVEVIAFLVNTDGKHTKYLYVGKSTKTDEYGSYKIDNLIPGDYVILAIPHNDKMLSPGFYVEQDIATIYWEHATRVAVEETGDSGPYKIVLTLTDKIHGKGIVRGKVGKHKKGLVKSGEEVQVVDAVNGASVYLLNSKNTVTMNMTTDDLGSFELSNIAAGTYTLVIDKIGYSASTTEITIGEESVVEKEFEMSPTGTTGVNDNDMSSFNVDVYPNPASEFITVEFNQTEVNATVTLMNYAGIVISNQSTANANSTYVINTNDIPAGVYFVKVQSGSSISIKSVVVVK